MTTVLLSEDRRVRDYERLSFHIPSFTVTSPSRRAASMKAPSCSIVRSYPGANLSIVCIRSRLSCPKFVNIPSMNYHSKINYHNEGMRQSLSHLPEYFHLLGLLLLNSNYRWEFFDDGNCRRHHYCELVFPDSIPKTYQISKLLHCSGHYQLQHVRATSMLPHPL